MFRPLIFIVLLTLSITAIAQEPIPKIGNQCPTGYYSSGDFCKPFDHYTNKDDPVIEKVGNTCPPGFRSSGDYCKRVSGSDREALPR